MKKRIFHENFRCRVELQNVFTKNSYSIFINNLWSTNMSKSLILNSEELKTRADLVSVDGQLYDLTGFAAHHPGGSVIEAAGAYDASALYHSMHPGRDPMKSELFQKFHVGTHKRESTDETPVFVYDSPFALDLQKTVRQAMGGRLWTAPLGFWIRTILICALTVLFEYQWATTGSLLTGVMVGILHAHIGLSVQHGASMRHVANTLVVTALVLVV